MQGPARLAILAKFHSNGSTLIQLPRYAANVDQVEVQNTVLIVAAYSDATVRPFACMV